MVTIDSKRPNRQFWKGKRVLVTGDAGFKGSWLVNWLHLLESEIFGVDKNNLQPLMNSYPIDSSYHHVNCDLALQEIEISKFPEKFDFIFHLAAQPIISTSHENPIKTIQNNLMSSLNLLGKYTAAAPQPVFVMASTDKVYKEISEFHLHVESDQLGGQDPYSLSKVFVENFLELETLVRPSKLVIVRSGNVIGGGDFSKNRLVPDIFRSWSSKKPLTVRNPEAVRPWLSVIDSLNGYLLAAENAYEAKGKYFESFNFAPHFDDHFSVQMMIELSLNELNCSQMKSLIGKNISFKERKILALDANKARKSLGWEPTSGAHRTIKMAMDWYRLHADKHPGYLITRNQIEEFMKGGLLL